MRTKKSIIKTTAYLAFLLYFRCTAEPVVWQPICKPMWPVTSMRMTRAQVQSHKKKKPMPQMKKRLFAGLSYERVITSPYEPQDERLFIFIVPSYNNKDWYSRNLGSIFAQQYRNYLVIYVDDASTDGTADLVEQFAKDKGKWQHLIMIRNKQRLGMVLNRDNAIRLCPDNAVCLALDGDDWLPHAQILNLFNKVYAHPDVWMTYGQFVRYPGSSIGICEQIPDHVIRNNGFRNHYWVASHLKTFYAWLYKQIPLKTFMMCGKIIPAATDVAMTYPMLEMAGFRSLFIPEITYVYNKANQLNVHRDRVNYQAICGKWLRRQRKFAPLRAKVASSMNQAGAPHVVTGAAKLKKHHA